MITASNYMIISAAYLILTAASLITTVAYIMLVAASMISASDSMRIVAASMMNVSDYKILNGYVIDKKVTFTQQNIFYMRKITEAEAEQLSTKTGKMSKLRAEITNMKPGEILLIEKKDVRAKEGPGEMITRVAESRKKSKYTWETLTDKSGWVVKRLR